MKVAIILPTYNEKDNIDSLVRSIFHICSKSRINAKIIVVDDNSPDGTGKEVINLSKKYPITLISRNSKLGLGSAYVKGFKKALKGNFDYIFEMDADWSHNPKYIPKFIEKMSEYDVVIGSRYIKGGSVDLGRLRKFISWSGNLIGRWIAGLKISDVTSGYRCFKRKVLESIDLDKIKSKSYDFQLEVLWEVIKRGYTIGAVPIVFPERRYGKSKLSKTDQLYFLLTALKIRMGLI